jgi:hypothetical protein
MVHLSVMPQPTTSIPLCLGISLQTLLNHILTQNHGKRIAVIENEVCSHVWETFVQSSLKATLGN